MSSIATYRVPNVHQENNLEGSETIEVLADAGVVNAPMKTVITLVVVCASGVLFGHLHPRATNPVASSPTVRNAITPVPMEGAAEDSSVADPAAVETEEPTNAGAEDPDDTASNSSSDCSDQTVDRISEDGRVVVLDDDTDLLVGDDYQDEVANLAGESISYCDGGIGHRYIVFDGTSAPVGLVNQ